MKLNVKYDMEKAAAMGMFDREDKYSFTTKNGNYLEELTDLAYGRLLSSLGERIMDYGRFLVLHGYFDAICEADPKVKEMMNKWCDDNNINMLREEGRIINLKAINYSPLIYLEAMSTFITIFHKEVNAKALLNLILNEDLYLENLLNFIIIIISSVKDSDTREYLIDNAIHYFIYEKFGQVEGYDKNLEIRMEENHVHDDEEVK